MTDHAKAEEATVTPRDLRADIAALPEWDAIVVAAPDQAVRDLCAAIDRTIAPAPPPGSEAAVEATRCPCPWGPIEHRHNRDGSVDIPAPAPAPLALDVERLRLVYHERHMRDWSGDRRPECRHKNQHRSTWDCWEAAEEMAAEYAALAPQAPDAAEPRPDGNVYAWLIERGQEEGYDPPVYYGWEGEVFNGQRYPAWTRDANRAKRFASEAEAREFQEARRFTQPMPGWPVEHGFIAAEPRPQWEPCRFADPEDPYRCVVHGRQRVSVLISTCLADPRPTCACGHPKSDHYFGDQLGADLHMHTWCQRSDGCNDFEPRP